MQLSDRIQKVAPSLTIAITAKSRQLKDQGVDIISFGAGEPDFDTPEFITNACIDALKAGDTRYMPRKGAALKQAIADKLERDNGLSYDPSQIIVTVGGKHALFGAFQALLNPGDKVAIPTPYWVSYPEQVKFAGGEPVFLQTSPESNFKITPDQINQAAQEGVKILIFNSPSNPSGAMYTPDEIRNIAQACLENNIFIISDEIYEKLVYNGNEFMSVASVSPEMQENTLIINGLSKTFAMTGWRLGWAAGPKDLIAAMSKLLTHETTNPTSFAQAGALAAYTDPQSETIVEEMRKQFEIRGKHMAERINQLPGMKCQKPAGAFYCFADITEILGKTVAGVEIKSSMDLAELILERANVAIVPGIAFGEDRCVRFSFATSLEQIDTGLDKIAALLAE